MADEIISRDMIATKARNAFARGADRDAHGFNPGAPAIDVWQEEWDTCFEMLRQRQGEGTPP